MLTPIKKLHASHANKIGRDDLEVLVIKCAQKEKIIMVGESSKVCRKDWQWSNRVRQLRCHANNRVRGDDGTVSEDRALVELNVNVGSQARDLKIV